MPNFKVLALLLTSVLFLNLNFPPVECEDDQPSIVGSLNDTQKAALKNFMKVVLNVNEDNSNKSKMMKARVPKQMMELTKKIKNGEIICSMEPLRDFVPHLKDLLVYNMSSIAKWEKIKSAQLYIFRRKLFPQKGHSRKRLLPPPFRVRLYQLLTAPASVLQPSSADNSAEESVKELSDIERLKLRSLDSISVAQITKGGWHTIDVSMALKEMFNSPSGSNTFIFGVRFEGPKGKAITPQRFLKDPDANSSSSFILTFAEEGHSNEISEHDAFNVGFDETQIEIMSEILKKAAVVTKGNSKSKKKPKAVYESEQLDKEIKRHSKRKMKKVESINSDGYGVDQIRHGRKYYGNSVKDYLKYTDSEDEPIREKYEKKSNYGHRFSFASPGNGDIVELLDYDKVKKAKALRRHNHKTINSLNLRYDTATKSIVQKKADRPEYDEEINDELNQENKTRSVRSVHDEESIDYMIEFSGRGNDISTTESAILGGNDNNLDKDSDDWEKEDDMGDLSYYEPEAISLRHKYKKKNASKHNSSFSEINNDVDVLEYIFNDNYKREPKTDIQLESEIDTEIKPIKARKERHKGEKRRHRNQKIDSSKKQSRNTKHKNSEDGVETDGCHLTKIYINFTEIGIDNVIAPPGFFFGYCSGTCPLKKSQGSNYLTMLNWLHSYLPNKIPNLNCCVPSNTTSLVVLKFSPSGGNVVLKKYDDISAEACKCR